MSGKSPRTDTAQQNPISLFRQGQQRSIVSQPSWARWGLVDPIGGESEYLSCLGFGHDRDMNLKTAVEDKNVFFVFILWAENCLGSLTFGVKSFDCANREIGAPGNRFLSLKEAFLGGRASRPPERKAGAGMFNCGFQDEVTNREIPSGVSPEVGLLQQAVLCPLLQQGGRWNSPHFRKRASAWLPGNRFTPGPPKGSPAEAGFKKSG
jgi:hypothetical protein